MIENERGELNAWLVVEAPFTLEGLLMSMVAWNLSVFTSMPLLVSMKPNNLLAFKPKEHMDRFRRML